MFVCACQPLCIGRGWTFRDDQPTKGKSTVMLFLLLPEPPADPESGMTSYMRGSGPPPPGEGVQPRPGPLLLLQGGQRPGETPPTDRERARVQGAQLYFGAHFTAVFIHTMCRALHHSNGTLKLSHMCSHIINMCSSQCTAVGRD